MQYLKTQASFRKQKKLMWFCLVTNFQISQERVCSITNVSPRPQSKIEWNFFRPYLRSTCTSSFTQVFDDSRGHPWDFGWYEEKNRTQMGENGQKSVKQMIDREFWKSQWHSFELIRRKFCPKSVKKDFWIWLRDWFIEAIELIKLSECWMQWHVV